MSTVLGFYALRLKNTGGGGGLVVDSSTDTPNPGGNGITIISDTNSSVEPALVSLTIVAEQPNLSLAILRVMRVMR